MSRRNNGNSHKLDLKLNLSLPTRGDTSRRMESADDGESSPSSCLSSENEQDSEDSSMVLAACPHCLMYVMLSGENLKCPKCKMAVILNFLSTTADTATTSNKKIRKG